MYSKLEPAIWSPDTGQRIPCFDRCQLIKTWMSNIKDVCCKLSWYWSHWHTWRGGWTYVHRDGWWHNGYKTTISRIDGLPHFLNSAMIRIGKTKLIYKPGIHTHFFIEVVSWASTSYDILARTNFGLPRQKCGNIDWMVNKITCNLSICDLFYTLVQNYELWLWSILLFAPWEPDLQWSTFATVKRTWM